MAGGSSKSITRRKLPGRSGRLSGSAVTGKGRPDGAEGAGDQDRASDSPSPHQADAEMEGPATKRARFDSGAPRPAGKRVERNTPPPSGTGIRESENDDDSLSHTDDNDTSGSSTSTSSRTSPKPQGSVRSASTARPPLSIDADVEGKDGGVVCAEVKESGETSAHSTTSTSNIADAASDAEVASAPAPSKQQPERRESQRTRRPANIHEPSTVGVEEDQAERDGILASVMPKLDQIFIGGMYRPWFHSKFYKAVAIPRRQRLSDLKIIQQMEKEMGLETLPKAPRPVREKRRKTAEESDSDDEAKPAGEDTWVNCDQCGKWRKVKDKDKRSIDLDQSFLCKMLPNMTCSTPEEYWDDDAWDDEEESSSLMPKSKKRAKEAAKGKGMSVSTLQRSCSPLRGGGGSGGGGATLQRSGSPRRGERSNAPLSPTGSHPPPSPTAAAGGPSMSRLEAVIRVLRSLKKVMHYEALTKQALRMGLIRFSGSQGTAGESMKAFLNKIIRENRSNSIVNLGKGVYGLKEWVVEGGVVVDTGDSNEGGDSKNNPLPHHSGILNWNDFQHRYGGRGHSREQLHDMYLTTCGGSVDPSPIGSAPSSFPPTPTAAGGTTPKGSGSALPKGAAAAGGGVTGLAAVLNGFTAAAAAATKSAPAAATAVAAKKEEVKAEEEAEEADKRMSVTDLIN